MRPARLAAAAAVAALALWAAWALVWVPFSCQLLKAELMEPSYAAFAGKGEAARAFAQRSIERIEKCLTPVCRDVEILFLLAINYRTLDRTEVALRLYDEALQLDNRPEIYANIADARLAIGDRDAAYRNYLRAVLFYPGYIRLIDDPALRAAVRAEVLRRYPGMRREIEKAENHDERWNRRGAN